MTYLMNTRPDEAPFEAPCADLEAAYLNSEQFRIDAVDRITGPYDLPEAIVDAICEWYVGPSHYATRLDDLTDGEWSL